MSNRVLVRILSPEGGVFVFLNGFLLFGADEVGRSATQAAPFLRAGRNTFEITPERADTAARLSVVDLSQGDPQTAPVLLQMETGAPGAPVAETLAVDGIAPDFAWHRAEVIDAISGQRRAVYDAAETLASLLARGPDQELLSILGMKHAEMARSVGLTKDEMDNGLLEGLSELRGRRGFRVDLAAPEDFLPLLSSDSRIVNLRRISGGDAIRIIDGISDPGFSVAMARISGRWHVVR